MSGASLNKRHIQNESLALYTVKHWGYPSRSMPCTNDPGSCEYLDGVYWMHDVSMLYTFIMWAVIGGFVLIVIACRLFSPGRSFLLSNKDQEEHDVRSHQSLLYRSWRSISALCRRWLLPEFVTSFFGHVTRLQILILAILLAYLLVFSLVGIVYRTWITPVKGTTLFNTRTGLGGFSDRVGALAYALTPLTVALSTRDSILTLVTGISYQHFSFLHRWTGRIIFVQSFIHTLGWTLIEGKFYQPQPTVFKEFIKQPYMIWGCVAMTLITFLYIFSIRRVVAWTGHEFFRKAHYLIAAVYLGACWGHWSKLSCWMIASLGIFGIDRAIRLMRSALIHTGYLPGGGFGFKPAQASLAVFDDSEGSVVRIDFSHNHDSWRVGQHFFLCFPGLTIWQSHPFTVASLPSPHPQIQHHTYIVRCLKGETSKIRTLAHRTSVSRDTTPVILAGPYGVPMARDAQNLLFISGGTGVSLTLPLALEAAMSLTMGLVKFVWIVRHAQNLKWISAELETLKSIAGGMTNLEIQIFVTREENLSDSSPHQEDEITKAGKDTIPASKARVSSIVEPQRGFDVTWLGDHHPAVQQIVQSYIEKAPEVAGRVQVIASGPAEMGQDLRSAVALCNSGRRVWKGDEKFDVGLHWDNRTD